MERTSRAADFLIKDGTTRLKLVLLALLCANGPDTGYGLGRLLNQQYKHLWPARLQQIYAELHRLDREELVKHSIRSGRRNSPSIKVYTITPAGVMLLKGSLDGRARQVHRDDLLVPLLCAELAGISELSKQISLRLEARQTEIAQLRSLPSLNGGGIGERLALEFEASRLHAETEWCINALALLARDSTDGGPGREAMRGPSCTTT
jgi:DNA-binding PadR family transcriptional regulator